MSIHVDLDDELPRIVDVDAWLRVLAVLVLTYWTAAATIGGIIPPAAGVCLAAIVGMAARYVITNKLGALDVGICLGIGALAVLIGGGSMSGPERTWGIALGGAAVVAALYSPWVLRGGVLAALPALVLHPIAVGAWVGAVSGVAAMVLLGWLWMSGRLTRPPFVSA